MVLDAKDVSPKQLIWRRAMSLSKKQYIDFLQERARLLFEKGFTADRVSVLSGELDTHTTFCMHESCPNLAKGRFLIRISNSLFEADLCDMHGKIYDGKEVEMFPWRSRNFCSKEKTAGS